MIQLFHNPTCSKSREALALLSQHAASFEVVDYLTRPLSMAELRGLCQQLGVPARKLLRSGEAAYQTLGLADEGLSDDVLLAAIVAHPILLQRPIVVNGSHAVIARPPELLNEWLRLQAL
jgi:arsenate reductase